MGTALKHVLGRERKAYVKAEGTYGTQVFPSGTDAFRVLTLDMGSPAVEREDRADFRTTRSVQERITGKAGPVEWSAEGYLIPSGTLATVPDMAEFLKAAMGYEITNVGTALFTGSGLDDGSAAGTYSGSDTLDYRVEIDGTGTPDTFRWSKDGGATWEASTVPITGSAVTLDNGVTFTHVATTGHTVGDRYDFVATDGVVYDLTDVQGTQDSLCIYDNTSDVLLESVDGAIVQTMVIKGAGGDSPKVMFSGVAADYFNTMRTTLDDVLSGGEAQFVVDEFQAGEVGSLIAIGSSSNSGNGHQVTTRAPGIGLATFAGSGLNDCASGGTYSGTTDESYYSIRIDANGTPDTFAWSKDGGSETAGVPITAGPDTVAEGVTVTFGATTGHLIGDIWTINVDTKSLWTVNPVVAGAQADGVAIVPRTPVTTTAGTPVPGVVGSMTLGGDSFPVMAYEITINNNHQPIHDEALQDKITDFTEDTREVRCQFTVKAREDQVRWIGRRKDFDTFAVSLVLGNVAGSILTITLPALEIEFNAVDKPASGSGVVTLPGKALGTNNELRLEFT